MLCFVRLMHPFQSSSARDKLTSVLADNHKGSEASSILTKFASSTQSNTLQCPSQLTPLFLGYELSLHRPQK